MGGLEMSSRTMAAGLVSVHQGKAYDVALARGCDALMDCKLDVAAYWSDVCSHILQDHGIDSQDDSVRTPILAA